MTSLVEDNQGLASILTEVSSIANYKKPTTNTDSSDARTSLGSDTTAAASLISDLSSIANYKNRRRSTTAVDQSVKKGNKNFARSNTVDSPAPTTNINSILKEKESDNKHNESISVLDTNNNSTAFYDVFDFSMSEVDLPKEPNKARKMKSASRANMARKLS